MIENQIEKTDHRHLGQLLTYAAGLGAKTLIWISAKFTDEHRAAFDWLNDNTGEDISFFGLEIEVWRIGDSAPAPKFNIVCKPNDWSKAVKSQAGGTGDGKVTPHKQLQFDFWTAFKTHVEANSKMRTQKPGYQHWLNLSIGRTGFHLAAITSIWNTATNTERPEVRAELNITGTAAKAFFAQLQAQKEILQSGIAEPLTWHNPDEAKSCKIYVRRDGDFTDRKNWPELFVWLLRYLRQLEEAFGPIVKSL